MAVTMGARRRCPLTKKTNAHGKVHDLEYGLAAMQGWRETTEDKHTVSLNPPGCLETWSFAFIFDGHSGAQAARYASQNILGQLLKQINENDQSRR